MVTIAKTTSQIGLHMGVAFALMYAVTGSLAFGGIAAVLEPICNVMLLPFHDRLWSWIRVRVEARKETSKTRATVTGNPPLPTV